MEDNIKSGLLLNANNIKIQRLYFREMLKLIGIHVIYRAPYPGKHYTTYSEIDSNYDKPILVGCIFNEHPNLYTLRKIGWIAELQQGASLILVDYDLPNLLQGALFIIPSGIDNAKGRLFRVVSLLTSMLYPSSVTCEIVPEYEDSFVPETSYDYSNTSLNLLDTEPEALFR